MVARLEQPHFLHVLKKLVIGQYRCSPATRANFLCFLLHLLRLDKGLNHRHRVSIRPRVSLGPVYIRWDSRIVVVYAVRNSPEWHLQSSMAPFITSCLRSNLGPPLLIPSFLLLALFASAVGLFLSLVLSCLLKPFRIVLDIFSNYNFMARILYFYDMGWFFREKS